MEIKQHAPEQPTGQRRNQTRNQKLSKQIKMSVGLPVKMVACADMARLFAQSHQNYI